MAFFPICQRIEEKFQILYEELNVIKTGAYGPHATRGTMITNAYDVVRKTISHAERLGGEKKQGRVAILEQVREGLHGLRKDDATIDDTLNKYESYLKQNEDPATYKLSKDY